MADGTGHARDLLAGSVLVSGPGFRGALGEGAGDSLEPVWAPDSQSIVFTATTNALVAAYAESVSHLYQVSLAGGEPRALTSGDASHSNATFSPDGRRLGFLVNSGERRIYSLDRLAVAHWPWTGSIKTLARTLDRSVGGYSFSTDNETIYFSAEDSGRIQIWSVPIDGGEPRLAIERSQGVWLSMTIPPRAAIPVLFGHWETATQPAEVFRVDLTSGTSRRLTEFNVAAAAGLDWQPLRELWGALGQLVAGDHDPVPMPYWPCRTR